MYISGNVRRPFEHYMANPSERSQMDWPRGPNYPRPDYLSSSRKRLMPQLMFKSGILHAWGKKTAIALNEGFYEELPPFEHVEKSEAEIAWMIYRLRHRMPENRYTLERQKTVYSKFTESLRQITTPEPGDIEEFMRQLQVEVDEKLNTGETPPDTQTIDVPF